MIPEADDYRWDGDSFKGRRHTINRVDMLFGLGRERWSFTRYGHYAFYPISRDGRSVAVPLWECDEETIKLDRDWVLHQSLYATSWDQIYPMHDGMFYYPSDVSGENDLLDLLMECIDIWTYSPGFCDGSYDRFYEETSFAVLLSWWSPITADRIVVRRRPSSDFNSLPVPINSPKAMEYQHDSSVPWRAFAERICQNEYVKDQLIERQGGICPVCGRRIVKSKVIHHVDYDHECEFALSGEKWTRPRTRVQPDCERCHFLHPEMFENCLARLRAVHRDCNYLIEATL